MNEKVPRTITATEVRDTLRRMGLKGEFIKSVYKGDRDPFKIYADEPLNWDRGKGARLINIQAWDGDEHDPVTCARCNGDYDDAGNYHQYDTPQPCARVEIGLGGQGPAGGSLGGGSGPSQYCPPMEPKMKADADSRVEWVLANLCEGELNRLYKLMHDGRGLRVGSADEAVRRWTKGLS